jgi:hypothetical protein
MKKHINVKVTLRATVLVLLSLWIGYAAGYHRGVQHDQREWWSSVRVDAHGNAVFLGPQAKAEFDPFLIERNPIPGEVHR